MYAWMCFLALYGSIVNNMMNIDKAKSLLESGDIEQAQKLLLEITNNDKNNYSGWMLLCGIASRTENWQLGAKSFGQAVKLKPSNCLVSSGLVQSFLKLDQKKDALMEIERFKLIADNDAEDVKSVLKEFEKISNSLK